MVDVLIAGAGPTGLSLAAQVHAHGGRVRLVERRLSPRPQSPALIVQPRTLEVLEPLGLAAELIERGASSGEVQLHFGSRVVAVGLPSARMVDSAYPHLLTIPQWEVERVIEEHLRRQGVLVERGTELISYAEEDPDVACVLTRPDGSCERTTARYLVGCDGADSVVRRIAGIPFPVKPYRASAVLADLRVEHPNHDGMHAFLGRSGILFLFPLPGPSMWRLLVARRLDGSPEDGARRLPGPPDLARVVSGFPVEQLGLREPEWLTEVPLRHGQAASYRCGKVFLAGDAAHVHSPAGGQGMNTGIQDGINLGWKIALVARGLAPDELLDSYEAERWGVARWTRRITDPAFATETSDNAVVGLVRRRSGLMVAPLAHQQALARVALRVVGGLLIRYRQSPAVQAGGSLEGLHIRPGDRFPNARVQRDGRPGWLHGFLAPTGYRLLLCGPGEWDPKRISALQSRYREVLSVHRLVGEPAEGQLHDVKRAALARLGVKSTAHYLIRPDGYVAFCAPGKDLAGLEAYLRRWVPGLPEPSAVAKGGYSGGSSTG